MVTNNSLPTSFPPMPVWDMPYPLVILVKKDKKKKKCCKKFKKGKRCKKCPGRK